MDERKGLSDLASERPLAEEAVRWYEAFKAGNVEDAARRREFADWLKRSPRHVHHFLFSTALDRSLDSVDAERKIDVQQLLAEVPDGVVPLEAAQAGPSGVRVRPLSNRTSRRFTRRWSIAAALATVLVAGAVGMRFWHAPQAQTYSTVVGEQRAVQLPDGSVAQLNTRSRIEVRYSPQLRQIELRAGEALFKVARNGQRPFQVLVDGNVIQALGTQFNVYRRDGGVAVTVVEGKVSVRARDNVAVLDGGQEAKLTHGKVERVAKPDVTKAIAWRQRRLVFRATPLTEIVTEFNRYNRAPKIRLERLDGEGRHYTGTFDADDPESLALVLSQDRELAIRRTTEEIVIGAR